MKKTKKRLTTWAVSAKILIAHLRDGGIAQLARACGSYPQCPRFESRCRYQTKAQRFSLRLLYGPLVKRLRHRPFTAVTWVRFPYGSPRRSSSLTSGLLLLFYFLFSFPICLRIHSTTPTFPLNNDTAVPQTGQLVCPSSIAAPQFLQNMRNFPPLRIIVI